MHAQCELSDNNSNQEKKSEAESQAGPWVAGNEVIVKTVNVVVASSAFLGFPLLACPSLIH